MEGKRRRELWETDPVLVELLLGDGVELFDHNGDAVRHC